MSRDLESPELAHMVGRSAKVGSIEQVPRSWKAGPETGRMEAGQWD